MGLLNPHPAGTTSDFVSARALGYHQYWPGAQVMVNSRYSCSVVIFGANLSLGFLAVDFPPITGSSVRDCVSKAS